MDIHTKFVEFLDEHKEKFTDLEYKEAIEWVAQDRPSCTRVNGIYEIIYLYPIYADRHVMFQKRTAWLKEAPTNTHIHTILVSELLGVDNISISIPFEEIDDDLTYFTRLPLISATLHRF